MKHASSLSARSVGAVLLAAVGALVLPDCTEKGEDTGATPVQAGSQVESVNQGRVESPQQVHGRLAELLPPPASVDEVLRIADEGRVGRWADRWGEEGVDLAAPGPKLAEVRADCDAVVDMAVRPGLLHPSGEWNLVSIARRRTTATPGPAEAHLPVGRRDYRGTLRLPDGADVTLDCRAVRSSLTFDLLARVTPGEDARILALAALSDLVNWPLGAEVLGTLEEQGVAGGVLMQHLPRAPGDSPPLASFHGGVTSGWPYHLWAWSDGEHILLGTRFTMPPEMETQAARTEPWTHDFVRDPNSRVQASAAYYERVFACGGETRLKFRESSSTTPAGSLAGAVNGLSKPAPREARLHWLTDEEWAGAETRPVPELVAERLGLAPGAECPQVSLSEDPLLGDATAGVLDCERKEHGSRGLGGPVQWVLGESYWAVTLLDPNWLKVAYKPGRMEDGFGDYKAVPLELRSLLGADGMRLCQVPMEWRDLSHGNHWLLTPWPDAVVGLPDRYRVGDADWGRCRIYTNCAVLHIVFDLPKEE